MDFLFLSVEHGMRNVELSGQRTKECGQGLCLSQHNLDTMTAWHTVPAIKANSCSYIRAWGNYKGIYMLTFYDTCTHKHTHNTHDTHTHTHHSLSAYIYQSTAPKPIHNKPKLSWIMLFLTDHNIKTLKPNELIIHTNIITHHFSSCTTAPTLGISSLNGTCPVMKITTAESNPEMKLNTTTILLQLQGWDWCSPVQVDRQLVHSPSSTTHSLLQLQGWDWCADLR